MGDSQKHWYTMNLSAEEEANGNVLLTEEEARIVANAIEQMYDNLVGSRNLCRGRARLGASEKRHI